MSAGSVESWPPDLGALARASEGRLVRELALEPVALPADLARMDGVWQARPIVGEARAYRGDGIALARLATIEGDGLSIGNVLVVPAAASSAPIFGADLVWIGTRPASGMIACDLSPTRDDCGGRAAQDAAVAAALPPTLTVASGGALPAWCESIFSTRPLYTRFGAEEAAAALEAFDGYLAAFLTLVRGSRGARADELGEVAPEVVSRGIQRYCRRHREDDRGLLLLERLFGKPLTRRYLEEVLFPTSTDGCTT